MPSVRIASQPSVPSGGCIAAFALLAVVAAQPRDGWLGQLDASVTYRVAEARTASAIRAARAVSALAEPCPAMVALAAAVTVAMRRARWQAGCGLFLTVTAGMSARKKLSAVVARPRPPAAIWLAEPDGFSLPSRHTALAALTAGACASGFGTKRGASHAVALLAAAAVGASRVCLGVHWPSDVLAGWLFAAGWLELCRWLPPPAHVPGTRPGIAARPGAGRSSA
jgi:membrane-associated phospholipid phosphatase